MADYALQLPNFSLGVADDHLFDQVKNMALAAEAGGFASVWVMDHFWQLPPLGGPEQPILEAYTLLGALAAVTERVGLGTLVTGVTYRNPALLAKIVTTLDVISKGRAWLGIGAAWYDVEHKGLGFDYPSDKERLDRLEEALQICKAMFKGERPTHEGAYYRTEGAINLPLPIRPGGPRIMVGGGGEKRTLKLVATYADACNVSGTVDDLRHKIEVIERHCGTVGRDPEDIEITMMASMFLCASDAEATSTKEFLAGVMGEAGTGAMIVGTAPDVAAQVRALADAGADTIIVNLPLAHDADAVSAVGDVMAGALA